MVTPIDRALFSDAARLGLTQGGLEGIRPSRTNFEALGEDFQTYEKIGETGDSFGGKTITYQVYDPYGNPVGQTTVQESGLEEGLKQAAALAAIPLTAGGAGAVLGGALGLTGTAASALGNALISGAAGALTGQDPLKAALLSAGLTYGGSLLGGPSGVDAVTKASDAQSIAEYAQELAAQGLPSSEIETILKLNGVSSNAAMSAALSATDGTPLNQIVSDLTNYSRGGLFTGTTSAAAPAVVTTDPSGLQTVTATGAAPAANLGGLLSGLAAVPSAVTPQAPVVSTPMAPLDQPSQITVTGERAPESNLGDILATIDPSLIGPDVGPQLPTPVEQVAVTGTAQPQPTVNDNLAAAIAAALNPVTVPSTPVVATPVDQVIEVPGTKQPQPTVNDNLAAAIAATVNPATVATTTPTTPAPNEVVEVTGTASKPQTIGDVAAAVNAGTLYGPGMTGTQTTVYDKVLDTTGSKTAADTAATAAGLLGGLTLTDLLKAFTTLSSLGMLGGGGGGGGGGGTTSMTPTTPVPVGNADYYNAVQQYYNTYMPQTPRDVATPLQQWYEGKFGG